jgi:flagellar biosynthesis protein FlhG
LDVQLSHLQELPEKAREKIWRGLGSFEEEAQLMLVNTPPSIHENAQLIHRLAHHIVVMVPSDPLGMMDAYSVIKNILAIQPHTTLGLVVYQVRMITEAQSIFDQMSRALGEFLEATVVNLGYLFADINIERSVLQRTPLSLTPARSRASRCLAQIAEKIWLQPSRRDDQNRPFFQSVREILEATT